MDEALAAMDAAWATVLIPRPRLPDEPAQAAETSSSASLEADQGSTPASISPAQPMSVTCRTQEPMDRARQNHQEKELALDLLKRQMAELKEKARLAEQAEVEAGRRASMTALASLMIPRPQLPNKPAQAAGTSPSSSMEADQGSIPASISPAKPMSTASRSCRTQEAIERARQIHQEKK